MPRKTLACWSASLVGVALFVLPGSAGASAPTEGCPIDLVTEGGACAQRISEPNLTDSQVQQAEQKELIAQAIQRSLERGSIVSKSAAVDNSAAIQESADVALMSSLSVPDPGGSGSEYQIPSIVSMTLWKEGQGNGKKSYTCGPSATRNMVAAMYHASTGSYQDFGENQFAVWEGTTTSGTARANVAAALNSHFASFGSWTTTRPADKQVLLSRVVTAAVYNQAVIMNVDTEFLGYWNRKALDHFNIAFGWKTNDSPKKIAFGEEWDPEFIYGHSFDYGNPYGKHYVNLQKAFESVDNTAIHGIVS